jgi:hypothetical protein
MNDTLEQQLRETYAEHDSSYDASAAAERLRARDYRAMGLALRLVDRAKTRARRAVLGGLLAGAAIAGVIAVINATPNTGLPVSPARQVIARTAAVVTGSGDGILHVDSTTTAIVKGRKQRSAEVDRWSQEKPPYDYWISANREQETKLGNTITAYVGAWNQISIGNLVRGPVPGQIVDPLERAVMAVGLNHGGIVLRGRSFDSPQLFAQELTNVIQTPGVTVERNAAFRGTPAVSITSANKRATLYVNPGTYRPLAFLATEDVLGNNNQVVETVHTTTVFNTYETVPEGSVKIPNLVLEHPHAKVPPWDRYYWRKFWSRESPGTSTTRQRALAELRN